MNGSAPGSLRVSPPTGIARLLVVALVLWVPFAIFLATFLLILGIPPLDVGLVVSVPSALMALGAALYIRARSFARRLLHLTLDQDTVNSGEVATGSLELRVERRFNLGQLTVRARGGEKVEIVVQAGQTTTRVVEEALVLDQFLALEPEGLNLMASSEGRLRVVEPGRYRFRFSVPIPATAPPSFRGKIAKVRYLIRVRASIPRRIDAISEIEVPVRSRVPRTSPPLETSAPRPRRSNASRPTLRVEMDSREVPLGGTLEGYVTVTNMQDRRLQGVRVRIREREWGKAKRQESSRSKTLAETELAPSGILGGLRSPFSLEVPVGATPSYVGQISSLQHAVRVRVRLPWARDLKTEEEIRVVSPLVR